MYTLIVASKNPGKAREIRAVLDRLDDWEVIPLPPNAPEMEETGQSFIENAIQKAEFYSSRFAGWSVADDSGLEVEALGGRPGIHSARYAPTDAERNDKLLAELAGVPESRRDARFVCALALALDGRVQWKVQEHVAGRIVEEPIGRNGFGYDPLFLLPDVGRTMAEIDPAIKNRISHRGRALERLRAYLADRPEQASG
jgi:XTP/dITP diphosphohydrolase